MNTPHEPLAPDHPAVESLAREVLEREERLSAYTYSIPLAAQASWDGTRSEQVKSAPALARAVLDLTAMVKRVEALAEQMERESGIRRERGDYPNEMGVSAGDLRRVLNGGGQ